MEINGKFRERKWRNGVKKMNYLSILSIIKHNHIVRFILMPFHYIMRCIAVFFYQFSKDSRYLKSLHNKHVGKRCFIIGNGPSLTSQDLDLLKEEITFGSNKIYAMYDKTKWRPTYYLCTDPYLVAEIKNRIKHLEGSVKFVANSKGNRKADRQNGIYHLMVAPRYVINLEKYVQDKITTDVHKCISKTQTVTCTAIELAIYMGIKEIYLLGVDNTYAVEIQRDGTKVFHSGVRDHFEGGDSSLKNTNFACVDAFNSCYQVCQDYALTHGIKIFNCTRSGKLEVFERKNFDEVTRKEGFK